MKETDLIKNYPHLWHMAEDGSWDAIRERGLLSTSALLDLYEDDALRRTELETRHRPESVVLRRAGFPDAVIRDQKPMSDAALTKCLLDGLTPAQWYEKLNKRTFFWLSKKSLCNLLGAKAYRNKPQIVLTLDTCSLVAAHRNRIELSPINSGSTYNPVPRGLATFLPIEDYPFEYWRRKRRSLTKAIAELVVLDSVPDVALHVISVHRVAKETKQEIWRRPRLEPEDGP